MQGQYQSILKATSIFGGTQFVQILVGLVRSKFVALLIGTTGMGLNTIFTSSLWIFITIFGMGVNLSVVKDLSKAYDIEDWQRFSKVVKAFRHLLLVSGVIGTLFVIAFSPLLSQWTFDDDEHISSFCFLSLMVLFTLLSQGNSAVLVSSRKIKSIAKCSLVSSVISLLVAVPFFFFWGIDGIVPGIVLSTIGDYLVTYYFSRKVIIDNVSLTISEHWLLSKSFIALGSVMVLGTLLANTSNYLVNLFISKLGGLADLGLYGAGMSITMQTLTIVFASMGSDYFPRLSASMGNLDRMNQTMNEQSEIVLLLATPILAVFMVLAPLVVRLLLSEEFLPVTGFVRILCVGMLFRAASYALGYASFAKGDKKVYLIVEGFYANISYIVFAVVFYYLWGLMGLACSFVLNYLLYYFVIRFVDTVRFGYKITSDVLYLITISAFSLLLMLASSFLLPFLLYYCLGGSFALFLCFFYIKKLDEKTNLVKILLCLIKSRKNH